MKISIGSEVAKRSTGLPIAQAAPIIKEVGFDGIDYSFCDYPQTFEWLTSDAAYDMMLNDMQSVVDAGLELPQCHLPYAPGDVIFESGDVYLSHFLPIYLRCIEIAGKAGCPVAVIHLYFEDDAEKTFETNVAMIRKMLPALRENNVILAIENIYGGGSKYLDSHITKAGDIMRYITEINDPHVGVCLDVGHAMITHNDPVTMVPQFGKHLTALHIHSTARHDNHSIPGTNPRWLDKVNYDALSKALYDVGYSGSYNLEVGHYYAPPAAGKLFLQLAAVVARHYADLTGL